MKLWLEKNNTEKMYSTHNEGKSVIAERFIRNLENKIYKHLTSTENNVSFYKLDHMVNIYNSTIKMTPVDVKSNTNIDSSKKISNKDPKFKVANTARISKYQNIFAKGYVLNWSGEFFVIRKVRNTKKVLNSLNNFQLLGKFLAHGKSLTS